MDTLYTFLDTTTHYKTESVHFWGDYELSDEVTLYTLNPQPLNLRFTARRFLDLGA